MSYGKLVRAERETPLDYSDATLDRFGQQGDPLADEVIARLVADHDLDEARRLLHGLLRTSDAVPPGMPAVVTDYLDATSQLPPHDPRDVRRAQQFFELFGVPITTSLFCASLPSAYASWRGVKVLHLTARLETDVRRRIMETGQFLMDVLTQGGMDPGGRGVRSIQRVRLVHAAVRHLIDELAAQDPAAWPPAWGRPISQEELAGTLMSFSYVVAEPLPRLGLHVTQDDAEAYRAFWNVVGAMLGIDERLLPASMDDSAELVAAIRRRQYGSSPEGIALTAALVEFMEHNTPNWDRRDMVPLLIRELITDEVADLLAVRPVSRTRWHRFSFEVVRLIGLLASRFERDGFARRRWEPFAKDFLLAAFDTVRGKDDDTTFDLPDHLATELRR